MNFLDRVLTCSDCGHEFIFTAGEQLFFYDKQFKNDPKRCKPCKGKRITLVAARSGAQPGSSPSIAAFRTETRTECSTCGVDTTVPFKPTQGRPVLCRQCFQKRQPNPMAASANAASVRSQAAIQMNTATAELLAAASGAEHLSINSVELAGPGVV